ncbi:phospholipase A 2A, partial [Trifolium medium]|nr:phospholipase A 2A [Trifolium medium]
MSWGLGWKRPSEIFHLTLSYGNDDPPESLARTSTSSRSSSASSSSSSSSNSSILSQDQDLGFRIEL